MDGRAKISKISHALGIPLAFLLSIPAVFPLLKGGYFVSHDGLFHLYRLAGLDRALHQGVIYPRWFPGEAAQDEYLITD
jgi:hypothetical protein